MEVYFPDYPEKTSPVANDLLLLADSEDLDVDGKKKFKRTKAGNIESLAVQSLTYAALNTLATASDLVVGTKYLITDATTANIPLIVEAVAVNKIHTDAKSPDFPQDVIQYDFASDTIKWRWDTLLDISVAQDLRNLQNLTLGTGLINVHVSTNFVGSIGNNCSGIYFDAIENDLTENIIPANSHNIYGYAGSTYQNDTASDNVIMCGQVIADGNISNKIFNVGLNVIDSPVKATIYSIPNTTGNIMGTAGDRIMTYIDSGAWVILNVEP